MKKVETVKLTELKQHPKNARKGDLNIIAESLAQNGQYKPLIVSRATMHILAGNHTAQALAQNGAEKADVVFLDGLTPEQELKILLADNKTADNSKYDDEKLFELLQELETLDGTGFTPSEFAEIARSFTKSEKTIKINSEDLAKAITTTTESGNITPDEFAGFVNLMAMVGQADFNDNEIIINLSHAEFEKIKNGAQK